MQKFVPVIAIDGTPLMPTTNWRANELIKKGKALRRFKTGVFYIKLLYTPVTNKIQDIALGIDTGSKREGFTIKSESHTYFNILSNSNNYVSKKIETRRIMRRFRRNRNTPYRKNRCNKRNKKYFVSPAIKSRWSLKLRIIRLLRSIFPINHVIVEDVKARTYKNSSKWNKEFSPLEVGKSLFYNELRKNYTLHIVQGYDTFGLRKWYGLKKLSNKMSESFYAHNVDSWVLANSIIGGHVKPDNIDVFRMVPLLFYRRQLHKLKFNKNGKRPCYGGTMSLGYKRGSIVKNLKYGTSYIGGNSKNFISLHSLQSGARLSQTVRPEEIKFICYNYWRFFQVNSLNGRN